MLYEVITITAPAKDKGQSFLKVGREMWNWNPTISRTIKLPPSMLSQGWMGSDYTNDDMVNQRSVVVDYTHTLLGEDQLEGVACYRIELIPHEDAPVVVITSYSIHYTKLYEFVCQGIIDCETAEELIL